MKSELERKFETVWKQLGGPPLLSEYKFHPLRKWRFDFADPQAKVGIECEGGIWTKSRHTTGTGYTKDCEKYNNAALLGWRVFRFTDPMLDADNILPVINELV